VLTRGLELITVLAGRDEPVRARCGKVRVAAVAGVSEDNADRVLITPGRLMQVPRGGFGGAHHGGEGGHVVRGLADLDCGDQLVAGDG
jgi:hypothetical protein